MNSIKSSLTLGLSIITASAIYIAPSVIDWSNSKNVVSTTNGSVRLGKIYNEMLKASMEMKNTETGKMFISVDEGADRVYISARHELEELIKAKNKDSSKSDEKVTLEDASVNARMLIKVKAYIAYRTEYQPVFNLAIDEWEITVEPGENINKVLLQVKEYCEMMREDYLKRHQILKQV